MAAPWMKRRKFQQKKEEEEFTAKYPDIVIFIVNSRIQRLRLDHLRRIARKKGFIVSGELDDSVTHVVTEIDAKDHLVSILQRITRSQRKDLDVVEFAKNKELLSLKWFTSCMEAGEPVDVTDEHRLPEKRPEGAEAGDDEDENAENKPRNKRFSCQRVTPVNHPNKKYTDALEVLERASELRMGENSRSKALAFRKASAALKALPEEIKSEEDIDNLYDVRRGSHCKRVIMEILEHGYSIEVDRILHSDWYLGMSLFTGVFGCGMPTAARWCQMGLRSLRDVKRSYMLNLTKSQLKGIEYYHELNSPVTRKEAEWIQKVVSDELAAIRPKSTIEITGGFRRGKDSGHDVDFLISHPEEGMEKGILSTLLQALAKKGHLDYTDIQNTSNPGEHTPQYGMEGKKTTMDHYERCFSMFRVPKSEADPASYRYLTVPPPSAASRARKEESSAAAAGEVEAPADGAAAEEAAEGAGEAPAASTTSPSSTNGLSKASPVPERLMEAIPLGRKRKAETGDVEGDAASANGGAEEPVLMDSGRDWVAKRVDFVVAPASQYPFALLGWTGSKMFNRSMRDYANKVMNMNLSSHSLFDKTNNCSVPAKTEEEIFELLNLEYRQLNERNC